MRHSRRAFLRWAGSAAVLMTGTTGPAHGAPKGRRPSIVLILTDDQGYGDLGCHGNERIRTPNLDRLHAESVRFTQFYASPVCSPTRASLMTGRYNYRTGAIDTYIGRSMMHPEETTVAELLRKDGYRTGIFGKWHLGDNYPMRPCDQGFDESLVHNGGGLAQPSDPEFFERENTYFDPILRHNGVEGKHPGYCTDIFTDAAIGFIEANRKRPFFVYLATNAPHTPLQVPEEYAKPYRDAGLDDDTARIYGMITNIDDNVGRVLDTLRKLDLEENTIVVFMTDNGPQQKGRFNAGLRDTKGTVYEGGIRVPCFVRWPARVASSRDVNDIAAHIDMLPTLLDACGVKPPKDLKTDGRSLLPLLTGPAGAWPERTLFFQWHRGDKPEPFRNAAVRTPRYKLVNGTELYDIPADPSEEHDIAAQHPDIVARLRTEYKAWLEDVSATRGYDPPRIVLGTRHENPVRLTRQDWRGAQGWSDSDTGYWEVEIAHGGRYDVAIEIAPSTRAGMACLHFEDLQMRQPVAPNTTKCLFEGIRLRRSAGRLDVWVADGENRVGPRFVVVKRTAR